MALGDHLKVRRHLYSHHGIDMGDGTVVHASGEPGRMKLDAEVRRTPLADFLRGGEVEVANASRRLSAEQITERALAALGGRDYSLLFNNCEHFALWCETGRASSRQIDGYALLGTALGVGARIAIRVASRRVETALALRLLPVAAPLSTAIALAGAAVALRARLRDQSR
jgi:hypothetical protein